MALVESTNESFYLKYDINEGIVSNTYACFSDNGKEYCVEPEKYEENVYLMNKVFVNDYDLSCSSDMYNKKDKQYCWLPALYRQDANGKISGTICSRSDNVLALYDDGNVVLSPAGDIILHLYIKDNGISGASD